MCPGRTWILTLCSPSSFISVPVWNAPVAPLSRCFTPCSAKAVDLIQQGRPYPALEFPAFEPIIGYPQNDWVCQDHRKRSAIYVQSVSWVSCPILAWISFSTIRARPERSRSSTWCVPPIRSREQLRGSPRGVSHSNGTLRLADHAATQ